MPGQLSIQGDAGFITVAAGAKAGIIKRWNVRPMGSNPDGTTRLRFKAQFSYVNPTLLGLNMKKRVVVQMKTVHGHEDIDILQWSKWEFVDGILVLDDVTYFHGVKAHTVSAPLITAR